MAATTQEVLTHHLHTFGKGDLTGVMADYSPESRLFTPNGMLKGPEAIRQLFTTQFKEFAKPGASFQMLRQDVDGDTAYILWKAESADDRYEIGTGTFGPPAPSAPCRAAGRSRSPSHGRASSRCLSWARPMPAAETAT